MNYIMVQRDTRFWLVGPFASNAAAGEWGSNEANNPSDDPRWQTIELADVSAQVVIVPPDAPMAA